VILLQKNKIIFMKIYKINIWLSVVSFMFLSARAQTLTNLDFEQANPVIVVGSPYYPYAVTVASALPAWTVSYGISPQTQITFNSPALGSTWVTLIGTGYQGYPGIQGPIDENYSVLLQGGVTASAASISQTGLIPGSTQSLLFEAKPGPGPLDISIDGQNIPYMVVGTGANYTLYGADISTWAGDTEQLMFSALEGYGGGNNWLIDDISFSTTAVAPEPSVFALTAIGGLLFGARKWFVRCRESLEHDKTIVSPLVEQSDR